MSRIPIVHLEDGRLIVPGRPCATCPSVGYVWKDGHVVACPECNP